MDLHAHTEHGKGSPAWVFVRTLYKNTNHGSWLQINQSTREALVLAIRGRLDFDVEDFNRFERELKGGHWMGADRELLFRAAVQHKNRSACIAFERWANRGPFKLYGERLYVGSKILPGDHGQEGEAEAYVTSFDSEGRHLIACTYAGNPSEYGTKVKRRLTLTLKEVREMERARKRREKRACADAS